MNIAVFYLYAQLVDMSHVVHVLCMSQLEQICFISNVRDV